MHRIIAQQIKALSTLLALIDKAAEHAELEEQDLLTARLAPDMADFTSQIQFATDTAKFSAARLAGKTDSVPKWEDDESSFEELKARIQKAQAYLSGFEDSDFEGYEARKIVLPFVPGVYALGEDYLHEFSIPNFYFHVTTAYAILRHKGVEIGKRDYLGSLSLHPVEA